MSRIMDEAVAAFSRWRQMNDGQPAPPVKVILASGDEFLFSGLAVAPVSGEPGTVAISASGLTLPILVVRDSDVVRVEIGRTMPAAFGFQTSEH